MCNLPTGIRNIEGETDLIRDRNSKALLNTNNEALKAYRIKRSSNLNMMMVATLRSLGVSIIGVLYLLFSDRFQLPSNIDLNFSTSTNPPDPIYKLKRY